jgi:hypothetical protein
MDKAYPAGGLKLERLIPTLKAVYIKEIGGGLFKKWKGSTFPATHQF